MANKPERTTNILNVQINTEKKTVILDNVCDLLRDGKQHYLVTPNPEMVMHSKKDPEFLKIINNADLKLPDGTGLKIASYLTKDRIKQRIMGVDFILDLCDTAQKNSYSVFFLGGENNVAEQTANVLQKKISNLKISGFDNGGKISKEGILQDNHILDKINKLKPDILLVAFGFPKQEKFIAHYLPQMHSIKLAIGVGGAFDFLSGKIKRAPKLLKKFGFEWAWRLAVEPKRFKRIYTAVIIFPLNFLWWRMRRVISKQ
jgi:N-acetylglucosaminyldiphosphoundecaprenol N-acetyl-beta-D-mannosaminyltransferase